MKRAESMLTLTDAPWIAAKASDITIPKERKKPMLSIKADVLLLIAMPVALLVGLVGISAGVNYLQASGSLPPMILAMNPAQQPVETRMQPVQQQPAPVVQEQDNTVAWITLISTLAISLIGAGTGMFNTWMNVKLKIAMKDTQASLDVNTDITKGIAEKKTK